MSAPKVGIWRALGRLGDSTVRELLWPEVFFGLVIGLGGALAIIQPTELADRTAIVGDVLALSGALLAVVFTALALVVSIPSNDYLRRMMEVSGGGLLRFLDPFLIAVATQAAVLLLGLAYSLAAEIVPWQVEHAAFYLLAFLVVFGVLDVVALARSLVRHGLNRGFEASQAHGGLQPVERRERRS